MNHAYIFTKLYILYHCAKYTTCADVYIYIYIYISVNKVAFFRQCCDVMLCAAVRTGSAV